MTNTLTTSYLALLHLECLPSSQFSILLKKFSSVSAIAAASSRELISLGLTPAQAKAIGKVLRGNEPLSQKAHDSLNWLQRSIDHHLVCFEEDLYPLLLREIHSPPPLLFLIGEPSALLIPQLAIVGSRHASAQGKQTAYWLAKELSGKGFCICSGLAAGIDTQAHLGAISGDSSTIAVMGTGPDIIYPRSNFKLASQIQTRGALVSEFSLGRPPIATNFPRRNRIISGMSLGVIVIEAALKSGSLITARLAMEQNREVFAVPGSLHNPLAKGCHRLIKEGANLVDSIDSILEELAGILSFQLEDKKSKAAYFNEATSQIRANQLSDDEKAILQVIGHDECVLDTLVQKTKMDVQAISSVLLDLELKGLVVQRAGRIKQITTGLQEVSD